MSYGMQISDSSGNVILDSDDFTFRFVGQYSYTNDQSADVVVSIPGIVVGTHFATCERGFPIVEADQVRIKPEFGSPSSSFPLYLFRI